MLVEMGRAEVAAQLVECHLRAAEARARERAARGTQRAHVQLTPDLGDAGDAAALGERGWAGRGARRSRGSGHTSGTPSGPLAAARRRERGPATQRLTRHPGSAIPSRVVG